MKNVLTNFSEEELVEYKLKKRKGIRYDKRFGLLLISPWLLGLLIFKLVPILASLVISFTDFNLICPEDISFIGLENFNRLIHDQAVGYVFFQTVAIVIFTVPFQLFVSMILAKLLSSTRLKGSMSLRTLFFLPSIIPSVAILFMWLGFVDPATGWLNRLFIRPLGLEGFNNLYSQGAISLLFAISSLWSIGPGMLIMLGALQGIPKEVHEAARVDGAGPFTRFVSITIPLISPAIFFSLIINLVMAFGGVILLDRGNAFSGNNSPVDGYISYMMFGQWDFGYAATLAWAFFIVVMVIIYFIFTSSKKWVFFPDREV
ncbi:carbohydrate ABC transporter permease [Chloroflexota bacterium]